MSDNKPLELEAVNYVCNRLAKIDLKYSNPNYDENGGDLIVINEVNYDTFKSLNIQIKGRNVSFGNSTVSIHENYLRDNFVFFLYLRVNDNLNNFLYCFFAKDICKWNLNNHHYDLYIPKNPRHIEALKDYEFNEEKANIIKSILDNQIEKHRADISESDLSLLDNALKIWCITGGLPDYILTNWYIENIDFQYTLLTHDFFITCLAFIYSNELKTNSAVDYMFFNLSKYSSKLDDSISDIQIIESYRNDWLITYPKSYVELLKLNYNGSSHYGLRLILGDSEEEVEGLLIDNSDLYLEYRKK